jgi:integrase
LGSVYVRPRSPYFWWKFRDHQNVKRQMSSGIPFSRGKDYARAQLEDVEQACVTVWQEDPLAALLLAKYAVITKAEAEQILDGIAKRKPMKKNREPVLIMEAALLHMSSRKEEKSNARDFARHVRELEEFIKWSGVSDLRELTRHTIEEYIHWLETDGPEPPKKPNGEPFPRKPCKPDGIRHRLIMLRRACAIGASDFKLPNPFDAVTVRAKGRTKTRAFKLEQLIRILRAYRYTPREFAAIALMGCCGLRPSECHRLQCGDVQGDVLYIGGSPEDEDDSEEDRPVKTPASARAIPLPAFILPSIAALTKGQKPATPLFRPNRPDREGMAFCDHYTFGERMTDAIRAVEKTTMASMHLRKTFLNVSIYVFNLEPQYCEAYFGRAVPGITKTSREHYMEPVQVDRFRFISKKWNTAISKALKD